MAGNLIQITAAGRAALVAPGNTGTNAHRITQIGIGVLPFKFDPAMRVMPNERKRITTFGGENIAPDTVHVVLHDDTADRYPLYAFALYFESGVLFGVYVQDTPILEKSPSAIMMLAADVQFASIDATQLVFGDATFLNPPATTERQGVVELATRDETRTGTDKQRAVTPDALKPLLDERALLSGANFTGLLRINTNVDSGSAQLVVSPASSARGQEGKIRLFGTFNDANGKDTKPRLTASIRAGFDKGAWGKEYLDIWLNKGSANDAASDVSQQRVMRFISGGRVLIGAATDDGSSLWQVAGNAKVSGALAVTGSATFSKRPTFNGATPFDTANYPNSLQGPITQRTVAPSETAKGRLSPHFVSKTGIETGTTSTDYADLLVFNCYPDATGGKINALLLSKTGTRAIYHYQATQTDTKWAAAPRRIAYGDGDTFTGINRFSDRILLNGAPDDGRNALKVAGSGNFSGQMVAAIPLVSQSGIIVGANGGGGNVIFKSASAPTDQKFWDLLSDANAFYGRLVNDTWGQGIQWLKVTRIGNTISTLALAPMNGRVLIGTSSGDGVSRLLVSGDTKLGGQLRVTGDATVDGHLSVSGRMFAPEGTAANPGITFQNDSAADTGFFHSADGEFGVACKATPTARFTSTRTHFLKAAHGPTPVAGDRSDLLATTEWVTSALSTAIIGQIVFEPRTSVRAGFLKANGALLRRADYPALWAYAQASGMLVSDANWRNNNWGNFSDGDGKTTFRLPELRGEFLRAWDDGRGVDAGRKPGSFQDSQNRSHAHAANTSEVGDHGHNAWTDAQGWHGHHGWTTDVGDHQHVTPFGQNDRTFIPPWGTDGANNRFGAQTEDWDNKWFLTSPNGRHRHEFGTEGEGNHIHGVGIGGSGRHAHQVTVLSDGGSESRPRNVALLAMIRAY